MFAIVGRGGRAPDQMSGSDGPRTAKRQAPRRFTVRTAAADSRSQSPAGPLEIESERGSSPTRSAATDRPARRREQRSIAEAEFPARGCRNQHCRSTSGAARLNFGPATASLTFSTRRRRGCGRDRASAVLRAALRLGGAEERGRKRIGVGRAPLIRTSASFAGSRERNPRPATRPSSLSGAAGCAAQRQRERRQQPDAVRTARAANSRWVAALRSTATGVPAAWSRWRRGSRPEGGRVRNGIVAARKGHVKRTARSMSNYIGYSSSAAFGQTSDVLRRALMLRVLKWTQFCA